jgi:hypothetical protein
MMVNVLVGYSEGSFYVSFGYLFTVSTVSDVLEISHEGYLYRFEFNLKPKLNYSFSFIVDYEMKDITFIKQGVLKIPLKNAKFSVNDFCKVEIKAKY